MKRISKEGKKAKEKSKRKKTSKVRCSTSI